MSTFIKEDINSHGQIKWCPGCGSFSILTAMHQALPETGAALEDIVIVSGIGCSSRFVYYVNSYGFHGIHGRATAVATGVKIANPNLSVWVITGDGDGMAIGGNHMMHLLRRNLDINILLFNNRVYGLTKGQFSPTSPKGMQTKTSPEGVIDEPLNIAEFAMGCDATFYARVIDSDVKTLKQVLLEAHKHKGTALIEILQNCVIFADKIHHDFTDKKERENNTLYLEDNKPMLFGENKQMGLVLEGLTCKVVKLGEHSITEKDILIHHADTKNKTMHMLLSGLQHPDYPLITGIVRNVEKSVYEEVLSTQINDAKLNSSIHTITDLLKSGNVIEL